mmetsp:Transcript_11099/g.35154  ORF Transcript_11099/g.35154 Transcript_11099/m.35154 type:complete len:262 (-) Transcript_11099:189-974(-)
MGAPSITLSSVSGFPYNARHVFWFSQSVPMFLMKPPGMSVHKPEVSMCLSSHAARVTAAPTSTPGWPSTLTHIPLSLLRMKPSAPSSTESAEAWPQGANERPIFWPLSHFRHFWLSLFRRMPDGRISHLWWSLSTEYSQFHKTTPASSSIPGEPDRCIHKLLIRFTMWPSGESCQSWSVCGHGYVASLELMHLPVMTCLRKPSGVCSHLWTELGPNVNSQGHCLNSDPPTRGFEPETSAHLPLRALTRKPSGVNLQRWSLE